MEFYDGIFDPQFKTNKLKQKYYLIPLSDFSNFKAKVEKIISQSPRLTKDKQIFNLIKHDRKSKDLMETYQIHKLKHPYCPVLPKIKLEISKRRRIEENCSGFVNAKAKSMRQCISITPDPRMKFSDSLMVNAMRNKHSHKESDIRYA